MLSGGGLQLPLEMQGVHCEGSECGLRCAGLTLGVPHRAIGTLHRTDEGLVLHMRSLQVQR